MHFWRTFILVKIHNEKITKASHSIKRKDLRKLSGDPFFLCFLPHPPLASGERGREMKTLVLLSN